METAATLSTGVPMDGSADDAEHDPSSAPVPGEGTTRGHHQPGTEHDPSVAHLMGRMAAVEARVRAAVVRRRAAEQEADIAAAPLTSQYVERLLATPPTLMNGEDPGGRIQVEVEKQAEAAQAAGHVLRLRKLERAFGLSGLDIDILLVALAPDIYAHLEPLLGYLSDDLGNRRATIGLALELAGASPASTAARSRIRPGAPLVDEGLLAVDGSERPFLSRVLRVPDRVVMHLLGDDEPDPVVARLRAWNPPHLTGDPEALASVIARGARLCYLREPNGSPGRALAVAAVEKIGVPALSLDLSRLGTAGAPAGAPGAGDDVAVAEAAVREARLRGACLVAGPIDQLTTASPAVVQKLADTSWPTILMGSRSWDPAWAGAVPLVVEVPPTTHDGRAALWRALLAGDECEDALDPRAETMTFRLGPEQIDRAAASAWLQATYESRPISGEDLRRGALAQNSAALERLGRRIEPRASWDDLILPAPVKARLRELLAQARSREVVLEDWGLGGTGRGGRGLTALFAGPSGTGKTLAAEVIAHELGFDLYTVDLAALVDKYIGETEKNLDRIFDEAERVNGVLFFDEADALFGSRSEVRDSHDRYANLEVAYLLQRLELFDGIAMLATNMRTNIDEAFSRRMDAVMTFALPDQADRERLWGRFLGTGAPLADDLDLAFCAKGFALAGGSIRNICLAAAYYAADRGSPIEMADLIRGVQREYEKLGQLCSREEFGPYYGLIERAGR